MELLWICIHRVSHKICIEKVFSFIFPQACFVGAECCSTSSGSRCRQVREINNNLFRLDMSEHTMLHRLPSCCCCCPCLSSFDSFRHASPTQNMDVIAIQFVMGLRGVIFPTIHVCSLPARLSFFSLSMIKYFMLSCFSQFLFLLVPLHGAKKDKSREVYNWRNLLSNATYCESLCATWDIPISV